MKTTLLSIIFSLVSLSAIVLVLYRIKNERIGIKSAVVWIIMWIGIGFFSLFPQLLNSAIRLVNMESRMFFILTISVFVLFSIVFNLSYRLDNLQRDISKIIQELAITNYQIEKQAQNSDRPGDTSS